MQLSEIGILAEKIWYEIPNHFSMVELGNFVVMPNHVHGILIIDNISIPDVETRFIASDINEMNNSRFIASDNDDNKETRLIASLQGGMDGTGGFQVIKIRCLVIRFQKLFVGTKVDVHLNPGKSTLISSGNPDFTIILFGIRNPLIPFKIILNKIH